MKTRFDIIDEILKREGITKTELGKRMGITRQALNYIFMGRDISKPKFEQMLRVMGYTLDISVRKLSYCMVTSEELKRIIENNAPAGMYWAKEGDKYWAVVANKFNGAVSIQKFNTKEECQYYLNQIG